jgi:hypothetical protein
VLDAMFSVDRLDLKPKVMRRRWVDGSKVGKPL